MRSNSAPADTVLEARERTSVGGAVGTTTGRGAGTTGAPAASATTAHGRRGPPGGGRRGPRRLPGAGPGTCRASSGVAAKRATRLHLLGHGVAPVARDDRDALVADAGTCLDRGRTTSTPVPIASSTSRTLRPPLGSEVHDHAGRDHAQLPQHVALAESAHAGNVQLVSITTSVARSRAARVCADRPGAVSTMT